MCNRSRLEKRKTENLLNIGPNSCIFGLDFGGALTVCLFVLRQKYQFHLFGKNFSVWVFTLYLFERLEFLFKNKIPFDECSLVNHFYEKKKHINSMSVAPVRERYNLYRKVKNASKKYIWKRHKNYGNFKQF